MSYPSKDELRTQLVEIEKAMAHLLKNAAGWYPTDEGRYPNDLIQADNRFKEAVMWARHWIERT